MLLSPARALAQAAHRTSGTISARGLQFTVCPPKHRSTVCSQCYCSEETSITGTLEMTGKFTALSFYWLSRKIAATNVDLFYFNLWTTQEIKQGERRQTIRPLLCTRGRRKLTFSAWHGTDCCSSPLFPCLLQ